MVTVVARDRGVPPLESSATITLILQDVNNFAPMFSLPSYSATTLSIASVGTSILSVSATDADRVDNQITYSVQSENFTFSINSRGVIRNEEVFPTVVSCP